MARKRKTEAAPAANGQAAGGTTPPSSDHNGFVDLKTIRDRQEFIRNAEHVLWEVRNNYMARFQRIQQLMDPRRSIDDECGYARNANQLTAEFYQLLHETDPIANRINEVMTKEAYGVCPEVYEDEDEEVETDFEAAKKELSKSLRKEESHYVADYEGDPLDEYLERLNLVSGIGQYGVMLLGLPGDPQSPAERKPGQKLSGLWVFPELYAPITQWDTDRTSPRYGLPVTYQLTFADPRGRQSIVGAPLDTVNVHYSRIIHVPSDKIIANEVLGMERCRPHYRRIYDLQKLYGASAEGYWLSCFNLLSLESHPQLGPDAQIEDDSALRDVFEKMMSGLQRWGYFGGATLKAIGPSILDATPFIDKAIEAICIKEGIPIPVFKGYEIGEQASTENRMQWDDRCRKYQHRWITPRVLVPFYDRLINLGVLPTPGKVGTNPRTRPEPGETVEDGRGGTARMAPGGYRVHWPDISTASDAEKADVLLKRTQALGQYVSGGVEALLTPTDYLVREAGYTKEEAKQVAESAADHMEEVNQQDMDQQRAMIDEGLAADPTAQPTPKAKPPVDNVFCPTGPGGGIDPTCSRGPLKSRNPKWATKESGLGKVLGELEKSEGRTKEALEGALMNAGFLDGEGKPEKNPYEDYSPGERKQQLGVQLASAHDYMSRYGQDTAPIERALEAIGAEREGSPGEVVAFNPSVHEDVPGLPSGTPVKVLRSGWAVPRDGGGFETVTKAKVVQEG